MMIPEQPGDFMHIFKKKHSCKNICTLYKSPETVTDQGVINQFKCNTCNEYLFPIGIDTKRGIQKIKTCKCCGDNLIYVKTKNLEPESFKQIISETKKSIPTFSVTSEKKIVYRIHGIY